MVHGAPDALSWVANERISDDIRQYFTWSKLIIRDSHTNSNANRWNCVHDANDGRHFLLINYGIGATWAYICINYYYFSCIILVKPHPTLRLSPIIRKYKIESSAKYVLRIRHVKIRFFMQPTCRLLLFVYAFVHECVCVCISGIFISLPPTRA